MKSQPESSSQHDHPAIPSISTPSKRESPVNEVSTDQRPTNPPAIPTAISKPASTTTSALAPKTIPTPDQNKSSAQAPGHHLAAGHAKDDLLSREAAVRKRKYTTIGYGADEVDIIERTATS